MLPLIPLPTLPRSAAHADEQTLDEPLRKRQRLDARGDTTMSSGTAELASLSVVTLSPLVRDEKYYLPDGDCVLQVENTLFKVSLPPICVCLLAPRLVFAQAVLNWHLTT